MSELSDAEVERRRELRRQEVDRYAAEMIPFGYGSTLAIDCGDWITLRARVASLEAALRDISEKLECDTDCTLRPEVRCGECHQIRSGAHWCAGCVARRALSGAAQPRGEPE